MADQLRTFDTTVLKTSETGFKVADGDKWLTWSKFGADKITPPIGPRVRVTIDGRDFVRAVEVLESPKVTTAAPPAKVAQAPSVVTPEPATPPSAPAIVQDDRGVVVTRLSNLNTATAILSSGGRAANPDEVLALAARLEVWATR